MAQVYGLCAKEVERQEMITDKIDRVTHIPSTHLQEWCPPPISAKIELTRLCNYQCNFCANSSLAAKETMDIDTYRKIIEKLHAAGVKELGVFYYGESMMVPWLPKAIKMAKDVGFEYVFLTTNGSLASPPRVKACMAAGLDSLKFSFNFCDARQFTEVTNISPRLFHRTVLFIKQARQVRDEGNYKCGLFLSYIKYNGEQYTRMTKVLEELAPHLDEVYALPLYNPDGSLNVEGWDYVGGNPGRIGNMVSPVPCFALFTETHINYDGTGNACCFYANDNGAWEHGNYLTQNFEDVWNSEKIRFLRRAHLRGDAIGTACEKCIKGKL